jgi:hypothetical protein
MAQMLACSGWSEAAPFCTCTSALRSLTLQGKVSCTSLCSTYQQQQCMSCCSHVHTAVPPALLIMPLLLLLLPWVVCTARRCRRVWPVPSAKPQRQQGPAPGHQPAAAAQPALSRHVQVAVGHLQQQQQQQQGAHGGPVVQVSGVAAAAGRCVRAYRTPCWMS